MTAPLLALLVVQAAILLWSSVNLSEVFLQRNKPARLAWFVATFLLPLAIAWFGRAIDPNRNLCGVVDCIALAASVGFIRVWAVNRETEQFVLERALTARANADALQASRLAYEAEKLRAAAAALETPPAGETRKEEASARQRHLTTPLLRGGARSPRFPAAARR